MNIDQDLLCGYCREKNDFSESYMCEGGGCDESTKSYLEDHGLTEDKTCFGDIRIGDKLYCIQKNGLVELTIQSFCVSKDTVQFSFEENDNLLSVKRNVNMDAGKDHDENKFHLYLSKEDAVEKYEEITVLVIKEMAKTIAKFT